MTFQEPGDDRNDDFWYNYGYGAIDLTVDSYALDGHEGTHGLEESELIVDDVAWDVLTVRGTLTIPDGLTEYVFEDGVDPVDVGQLLVRADCIPTHTRFVADTIDEFPSPGEASFEAEINSDQVAGTIEIEPVLVRTTGATTDDYRYGQTPGLKLADGDTFEIDSEGDDRGAFLPVETKSFDEEREGRIYYLDRSVASDPRLFINSEVDLLVSALKSRAPYGAKRWIREALERLIGHPVWVELVLWTAADITDGECLYEWQENVVEKLAEVRDESAGEVAERLESMIQEADRVDTLVETTTGDAQDILEIDTPLENLLEEVL